jgi:F0F1-type ATP synthase assembly protein I
MWRLAAETGALGIEIAACIFIGYFGGQWLDSKFHSTPWLKWIGFGAGIGAAIKAMVRISRKYKRSLQDDGQQSQPGQPGHEEK